METHESPTHALEFLCRSWSPSASNFLQLISSSNLLSASSDSNIIPDHEGQLGETLKRAAAERNQGFTINNYNCKMKLNHVKGWLKGKPLTDLFRSYEEKKKDDIRFHTAKLHAALSLTQLAAAIAGFATSTSIEAQDFITKSNGETRAQYEGMGGAVANAAALMTTVCAEAAESLGAHRNQVASAVNSGLAISNPVDMMGITATTSTCLRGAAILKSRIMADSFPRIQGMLKACTQICIITSSGNKEYKWVTINSKPEHVTLCFRKKYFGILSTSKEYKLICIEETMEGEGYYFLSLKTTNGIIKLLFKDQKQLSIWISTISNLLKIHNPGCLSAKRS